MEVQFKILLYFSAGTNFQYVLTVGFVTPTLMFHMETAIVGIVQIVSSTMDSSQ
jgi:hypothetical protein